MLSAINMGKISAGHARAILSVQDESRDLLFDKIISAGLSVREAESMAKSLSSDAGSIGHDDLLKKSMGATIDKESGKNSKVPAINANKDPEMYAMEEKLIMALGTKVQIKGDANAGKIEVAYFSLADLERIYDILLCRQN
jgi:ParB family transcriptional regulator, chromosome partitioning protein